MIRVVKFLKINKKRLTIHLNFTKSVNALKSITKQEIFFDESVYSKVSLLDTPL